MGEIDLRVLKTIEGIEENFLNCLKDMGFQNMIIKNITDVRFIYLKELTIESYYKDLRHCLEAFQKKRREYLILWNDGLLGRNVFEEMIDGGVDKLVHEFKRNPDISKEKEYLFTLYARLFLGNMMVSVRWWFMEGQEVNVDYFTRIMILHMTEGIFPTLKNKKAGEQ